jgi:hypothetical protein
MKALIRRFLPVFFLAALFAPLASAADNPQATPEAIQKTAQACADALLKGDYPAFVQFTHPKIIEMAGGRDKMIALIKSGMDALKGEGITINAYKIEPPAQTIPAGDDLTAIVPTVLQMSSPTQKITQKSYLLAVSSDNGKHWTFVDGAGIDDNMIKSIIPNPPKELKLPDKQQPVIEKK